MSAPSSTPTQHFEVVSVALTSTAFFGTVTGQVTHCFPWTTVSSLDYYHSEVRLTVHTIEDGDYVFHSGTVSCQLAYFDQKLAAANYLALASGFDPDILKFLPALPNVDELVFLKVSTDTDVSFTMSSTQLTTSIQDPSNLLGKSELVDYFPWATLKYVKIKRSTQEIILKTTAGKKERYTTEWAHILEYFEERLQEVAPVKRSLFYGSLSNAAKYLVNYSWDKLPEVVKMEIEFNKQLGDSAIPRIIAITHDAPVVQASDVKSKTKPKNVPQLSFLERLRAQNLLVTEERPAPSEVCQKEEEAGKDEASKDKQAEL